MIRSISGIRTSQLPFEGDPKSALRVVIFSASDQQRDAHEAERLGANGYVRKPAGFEKLCATLAAIERDWLNGPGAPWQAS